MTHTEAFGNPSRYYADPKQTPDRKHGPLGDSEIEAMVRRLLQRHHQDVHRKVEQTCRDWQMTTWSRLSHETALNAGRIKVRVVDGLPLPFARILEGLPDDVWELVLGRATLVQTAGGLELMNRRFSSITSWLGDTASTPREALGNVRDLLARLLEAIDDLEILHRLLSIDHDVLGAYFLHKGEIHIYWMAIGVIAAMRNLPIEALALVTLIHEQSHACTHLGHDTDNSKWHTPAFAASDLMIVEGLAQFYTETVCHTIEDRQPDALRAFLDLRQVQAAPYTAYQAWTAGSKRPKELIRRCLIESRVHHVTDYGNFSERLANAKREIGSLGTKQANSEKGRKQPTLFDPE